MDNVKRREISKYDYLQKVAEYYREIRRSMLLKVAISSMAVMSFLIPYNPDFGDTYTVTTMDEFNQISEYVLTDQKNIDAYTTVIISPDVYNSLGANLANAVKAEIDDGVARKDGFEIANSLGYKATFNYLENDNLVATIDNRIISSKEDIELTKQYILQKLESKVTEASPDYLKVKALFELASETFKYGTVGDIRLERNLLEGINGKPVVCQA